MLLHLVRCHRKRRTAVGCKADRIVALHGRQGWSVAQGRACLLMHLPWHKRLARSVAARIRQQLNMKWGTDPIPNSIVRGDHLMPFPRP